MRKRNLYISDSVWGQLAELAKEYGCNISELIRRAIIEFLKNEKS